MSTVCLEIILVMENKNPGGTLICQRFVQRKPSANWSQKYFKVVFPYHVLFLEWKNETHFHLQWCAYVSQHKCSSGWTLTCEAGNNFFPAKRPQGYIHDFHVHLMSHFLQVSSRFVQCHPNLNAVCECSLSERVHVLIRVRNSTHSSLQMWVSLASAVLEFFVAFPVDANAAIVAAIAPLEEKQTSIWSVHLWNHLVPVCSFPSVLFDRAALQISEQVCNPLTALLQHVWSRRSSHLFRKF